MITIIISLMITFMIDYRVSLHKSLLSVFSKTLSVKEMQNLFENLVSTSA